MVLKRSHFIRNIFVYTVSAIAGGGLGFWPVKHSILELFP